MTGSEWMTHIEDAMDALDRANDSADSVADIDPIARVSVHQGVRVALDVLGLALRKNAPALRPHVAPKDP